MIIESIFILAFIAMMCSVDANTFGQFMICRPIFCAPLFGFLLGDIETGLWLGMIAEMIWVAVIPMGIFLPIDLAAIGVLSVFWASKFAHVHEAAILALVLSVPFAYISKHFDLLGRRINTKIMHWVEKGIEEGIEERIDSGTYIGLILAIVRFFVFYLIAMYFGGLLYDFIYAGLPPFVLLGFQKAWYLLPVFGFGTLAYRFLAIQKIFSRKG